MPKYKTSHTQCICVVIVTRLSLGSRQSVNLSVAQRTINNALTNGVVDRPWVVGREFESHVHREHALQRKVNFLMNLINHYLGPQRCFGVGTYGPIRRPRTLLFRRGGVL